MFGEHQECTLPTASIGKAFSIVLLYVGVWEQLLRNCALLSPLFHSMTKVQVEPQTDNGNSNTAFEPLLDPESSLMVFLAEPAISTISFFKGRDVDLEQSQKWLKERLTLICKSNPWLAGRLVKKKKIHKNLLLAIPQPPTESDVDALIGKDENKELKQELQRTKDELKERESEQRMRELIQQSQPKCAIM